MPGLVVKWDTMHLGWQVCPRSYAETVNPETLYAAWDKRLGK